jgi:SigmaW regulon antibacterial
MSDFITHNWLWLTFLLVATPLVTTVGLMWLRAWQLSLGAWMKGIHLSIIDLMLMNLRRVDTTLLVNQLLVAKQNNLEVSADALALHQLAGGNIRVVIAALLSAKRFSIPLTLERACAVDLVGQDPLQLISDAVHEAGKIQAPTFDGMGNPTRPPVNPATVLLQAAPGTAGTITDAPRMTARVRFPQGELDVVVRSRTVPNSGDPVRVTLVDGITVTVEPALA